MWRTMGGGMDYSIPVRWQHRVWLMYLGEWWVQDRFRGWWSSGRWEFDPDAQQWLQLPPYEWTLFPAESPVCTVLNDIKDATQSG